MKSSLKNFFSELRGSYWYTPMLMTIVAVMLSVLTVRVDRLIDIQWLERNGWIYVDNPEAARAILTTIASSMITVAGVTFSMTIVAVSFAASQIGHRLISNFMRDRANQITLGTFIATFLFCLMILRVVLNTNDKGLFETVDGAIFIPQISLLVAFLLCISSIVVLIYFVHHIPESINMSNVIAEVGEELNRHATALFPRDIGQEFPEKPTAISENYHRYHQAIIATQHGYIRVLAGDTLIDVAKKYDLIIQLEVRPGSFITEGSTLLYVYSAVQIDNKVYKDCEDAFALGHKRNQEQDIVFLINELIEIIARALSPGVNDPFTAMSGMDWLQLALQTIAASPQSSAYRYDSDQQLRLIAHPISFAEFCDIIFNGIRPYVCSDRNAAVHMMTMIDKLRSNSSTEHYHTTLIAHAKALKDAALECLSVDADRQEIQRLYVSYFSI